MPRKADEDRSAVLLLNEGFDVGFDVVEAHGCFVNFSCCAEKLDFEDLDLEIFLLRCSGEDTCLESRWNSWHQE